MKTSSSIILLVCSIMLLVGCGRMGSNQGVDMADNFGEGAETDPEHNDMLGLNLSVIDISRTGLCLICSQSGGQPTGTLKTGSSYNLEKYEGENWHPVIPIINNYGWQLQTFTIYKNHDTEFNIDWEWLYGKLGIGIYRLEKKIIDFREPGDQDEYTYYVEFEINDE